VKIRYPSRGEPPRWRTVDPVGLVHAAGRWYLLATDHGADRTYRVSRVGAAEVLDEPADRRPGTDLEQAWHQRRQAFRDAQPDFAVRARVRAARRGQVVRAALDLTGEAADTGGWLLVDLVFADPHHAETVLWGLGPDAQVIQPHTLRDTLARRAEQTLRQYRSE